MLRKSFVLMVLGVAAVLPQTTPRTQSIRGTVLDPSGAVVPDATVTLKRGKNSINPPALTGEAGDFRFDAVPEGTYSLEVIREGFGLSVTPLRIGARAISPLRIELAIATISSEIAVGAADTVPVSTEAAENRDSATVDLSLLERVPIFDQDVLATMTAFLDPASIGAGGTQLIVNGMEVNNVGVTPSAIQEVRINQNPYSAEFARPGRGRLEIITRATASEYHGTFNFIFRDSVWNARDAFALVRAPEQRRIFEGSLTGPLGHSKSTSFLFSGERQEEDLEAVVFARGLSGEIRDNVPAPKRNTQISFRVAHRFSARHTDYWQYNDREFPSDNPGVGGVVLAEAGTRIRPVEREVIFNDQWTLSPKWLNQFQILIGREREETTSVSAAPKIVVQDAFTTGGGQMHLLRTENHAQGNDIASWSSGRHLVKVGVNLPDWSRRGVDDYSNFGGTFFFSSLAAYAAGQPYAFRQQQGSGHVVYWQKELGGFLQDDYKVSSNLSLSLGIRYNWQNYLRDNDNFAPRLAFAYAPHKSRKTVLRGGAGIFYDRTNAGPIADVLRYNGEVLRNILITNPTYPDPFLLTGALQAQPSDIVRFAPDIREPYSVQYSMGVEEQVAKRTTIAATYRGAVGIRNFRSRDVNAPLPPDYLVRPDPVRGVWRQIESSGRQLDNALDVTLRGDVTRYFSGVAQYTLSHSSNNTGGITWFPSNQYNPTGEWSRSDLDQRHRFNLLGTLNSDKWLNLGIGLTLASGKPYTLTTGQDFYHTGLVNARPPGVPRNSLEGPGYADLDLRWSHDFHFNHAKREKGPAGTFAFDAFNVANRVNYVSYIGNLSSPFFGQAVASQPARRLQLTLRLKF